MRTVELVILVAAIVLGWAFILSYAVLAPWSRYWAGRHMMVGSLVITLSLTLLFLRNSGIVHDLTPGWKHGITITVYSLLAVLMAWRVSLMVWLQIHNHRKRKSQVAQMTEEEA